MYVVPITLLMLPSGQEFFNFNFGWVGVEHRMMLTDNLTVSNGDCDEAEEEEPDRGEA